MAFAAAAQLALLDQDWPPALLLLPEACEVAMIAGNMWVTQWGGGREATAAGAAHAVGTIFYGQQVTGGA